jgi:hypothetical protein
VLQLPGFFLGNDHHAAGPVSESLEHAAYGATDLLTLSIVCY